MDGMLGRIRGGLGAGRADAARARGARRARHLALEPLEARQLLAGSIFDELFPSHSSGLPAVTTKDQRRLLTEPTETIYPPYEIKASVAPDNDPAQTGRIFGPQVDAPSSAAVGTGQVSGRRIRIQGEAPPNATLYLAFGQLGYFKTISRADGDGIYYFDINLPAGTNLIRIFSKSVDNNYSRVVNLRLSNTNPIVAWDAIALQVLKNENLTGAQAAHDLAILHLAQYDAVAAVTDPTSAYGVAVDAAPGASAEAAADSAAYHVLASLYPGQAKPLASGYDVVVKNLPATQSTLDGLALGQAVAERTLAARQGDGSTVVNAAGETVRNPNASQIRPFAIAGAASFRPAAPPKAGTTAFDQALAEVTRLGRFASTARTADQTATAQFWDDPVGTRTDAGHWNAIAEEQASSRKTNLVTSARLFATLDVALADAAIAAADSQFAYLEPRPLAAIQPSDPTWTPLLATPPVPSYVSEDAAIAAAAGDVLASVYGRSTHFSTNTDPNNSFIFQSDPTRVTNVRRDYRNFAAAASEAAESRVLGGVAYRFDTTAGATLGNAVAKVARAKFAKQ